ncbi:hypothetical protein [Chitinophaga flava]|uniref:Prenyltransferase n=1 Tax=Chitinophaga flava TaxID=2259036 RepID=A0A365Y5E5_9BACT|nr:hypothetical protein [Chitinophaga flava]RBL93807.1 hypothetical protein DF182_15030 [Chitinophaga flava]
MIPAFTYLPFGFFLKTRLIGNFKRISWLFIYFIPGIFLYYYAVALPGLSALGLLVLGILLVNYVYDNGYLENDVLTIKKEAKPTLRLSPEAISNIQANLGKIVTLRLIICSLLLAAYAGISPDATAFWTMLAILACLQVLYLIYNRIRNIGNLFLIIPLSYIRFYGFILPFVRGSELGLFIIFSLFLYPFPKFIEFSTMPRYKKVFPYADSFNMDTFRVKYYFVYASVSGIISYVYKVPFGYLFFLVGLFYFLFRLIGLLALRRTMVLKDFQDNFGRSKAKK